MLDWLAQTATLCPTALMDAKTQLVQPEQIEQAILLIRSQRVMLDRDLATLYGVTTGNLNKAVQRNAERFPADFMFQLTADEAEGLRFHFGSLKRGQHFKYLPFVFTQEGVAMLSSVLRSPRAVQVNIGMNRSAEHRHGSLRALNSDWPRRCSALHRETPSLDNQPSTLNCPKSSPPANGSNALSNGWRTAGF
jgi:hypothetical protein